MILSRSLAVLLRTLQRDIYGLKALGTSINKVQMPTPDLLAAARYLCIYCIDYLCDSKPTFRANNAKSLQEKNVVSDFVRKYYLY